MGLRALANSRVLLRCNHPLQLKRRRDVSTGMSRVLRGRCESNHQAELLLDQTLCAATALAAQMKTRSQGLRALFWLLFGERPLGVDALRDGVPRSCPRECRAVWFAVHLAQATGFDVVDEAADGNVVTHER